MAKRQDQQRHSDRYEVRGREHEDLLSAAAQLFGRPHRKSTTRGGLFKVSPHKIPPYFPSSRQHQTVALSQRIQ